MGFLGLAAGRPCSARAVGLSVEGARCALSSSFDRAGSISGKDAAGVIVGWAVRGAGAVCAGGAVMTLARKLSRTPGYIIATSATAQTMIAKTGRAIPRLLKKDAAREGV